MNDKLAHVKTPGTELVDVQTTESQGPPGGWRRVVKKGVGYVKAGVGGSVGLVGDTVLAVYGEHAEPLRQRLKDFERKIAGSSETDTKEEPPTSPPDGPMEYELTSVAFMERIAVALYLIHLVPEVMSAGGWSHAVRLPIDRARQLLTSLAPLLGPGSGWEKTVSSCHGFINDIERVASELNRLDNRRDGAQDGQDQPQERRAKTMGLLTEAKIAMAELRNALGKLVEAARAYRPDALTP